MAKSSEIPVYRYETSYLNAVIRCEEPMPLELAQRIRCLHMDHSLDYETVPSHLCEGDTTGSQSIGAGKMLVELAAFTLGEDYRQWNPRPYDKT
jgi:hypothetical protein